MSGCTYEDLFQVHIHDPPPRYVQIQKESQELNCDCKGNPTGARLATLFWAAVIAYYILYR